MVPNQGIVFDDNNNPWMKPKRHDDHKGDRNLGRVPQDNGDRNHVPGGSRHERNNGGRGGPPGKNPGGPPDDPDDDGDDDRDQDADDEDTARHDPFTPRFLSRDVSAVPMARSLEVKAQHMERKFQQIMEFIRQNLEHKLSIPDGAKGTHLNVKHMKKYDRKPSHEVLWEWLRSVVFLYHTSQLGGPDRNEERVLILDSLLEGQVKSWFQWQISKLGGPTPTFVNIILALYDRFVYDSTLQNARDAFRVARWDEEDNTVQGWKDNIQQLVDDMDVTPDEYAIKNKFMIGLPIIIQNGVFADKLSVEYNNLEELYQSALDEEYALKAEWQFTKPVRAPRPTTEEKRPAFHDRHQTKVGRLPFLKQNTPYVPPLPVAKASFVKNPNNRMGAPPIPGKTLPNRNTKPESKTVPNPDHKLTERICFRCGQPGHIASNPICPEHGKKPSYDQLRAAHSIIMDAMSNTVGAEDHPSVDSDSDEPEILKDNMEYKFYDASDDADSSGENSGSPHSKRLHRMAEDGKYHNHTSTDSDTSSGESDNIIVYGCPMAQEERMETIPLFQFGGTIPSNIAKYNTAIRMADTLATHPDHEEMVAMTEVQGEPQQKGKVQLRISKELGEQPTPQDKRCLVTMFSINGLDVVTLWDSGSTSTAMSPAFADISKVLVSWLSNPVVLQLGMVGSRAKINFGTTSKIKTDGFVGEEYFDMVNIDKYDVIISTPFMHQNKVVLDFDKKRVVINDHPMSGRIIDGEEADKIAKRYRLRKPEGAGK
ncbi:uncharacterized protein ARMOST_08598 [Armillaria ostoyae]|uniref:CCHC-type domain-containing protein n=1 Tax=Armillaria ostoyae TaxID=47428 RepID=A0A284R961_ARMOS|nr:uncharacterized protein ARMOST_08598 [Armillaria ostoyae]